MRCIGLPVDGVGWEVVGDGDNRGDARYCFLPSILYQSTFHTVPVTVCPNILFLRSQTKFSPYLKDFPINLLNFGKLWHRFDHNPNYFYVYTFILT